MKNKKIIFGMILLLFAISGLCNVISVSANGETLYMPPSSYAGYYMGYLEHGDQILINDIDSDGKINVYIMKEWQFNELQDHDNFYSEKMWEDIVRLSGWRIDITDDDDYYVVLVNKALLTGKNVFVDISVYLHSDYTPDTSNYFLERLFWWLLIIFVLIGIATIVVVVLVKKHKRKSPKEPIIQMREVSKGMLYCRECGAEISDKTRIFCSNCGSKIILN